MVLGSLHVNHHYLVYAALLVDSTVSALAVTGRFRRVKQWLLYLPAVLLVFSTVSAWASGYWLPSLALLFAAVYLASSRTHRPSPILVLSGTILLYFSFLASIALEGAVVQVDPRLDVYVRVALALYTAAYSLSLAGLASGVEELHVAGFLASAAGLSVIGAGFLLETRVAAGFYGDSVTLSLLAMVLGYTACFARPAGGLWLLPVLAGLPGFLRIYTPPYISCSFSGCSALPALPLLSFIAIVLPLKLEEVRRIARQASELSVQSLLSPSGLLAAASALTALTALGAPVYGGNADAVLAAVAPLVAGALIPSRHRFAGLAAAVVAAVLAYSAYGVWAASLSSLALGLSLYILTRGFMDEWSRPVALLALALLLLSYTGAGWRASTLTTRVKLAGLDGPSEAPLPSEEVVHKFYLLYIGVKDPRLLYSMLARKVGRGEALRTVEFAAAIAAAAKRRGISDPYNITQVRHPDRLPAGIVEVEGFKVTVPARSLIEGLNYTSRSPARSLASLAYVTLPGSLLEKLRRQYLQLLANPNLTGGDALRYTLYTAMAISWYEARSLNETARLVFSALSGNITMAPVEGTVALRVLPGGLLAYLLYPVPYVLAALYYMRLRRHTTPGFQRAT